MFSLFGVAADGLLYGVLACVGTTLIGVVGWFLARTINGLVSATEGLRNATADLTLETRLLKQGQTQIIAEQRQTRGELRAITDRVFDIELKAAQSSGRASEDRE